MNQEKPIILSSGYAGPEVFPVERLADCSMSVLRDEGETALQYSPRSGLPSMKRMLAEWMIADGATEVESSRIAIITGAKQGIDLASRALAQPGDTVFTSAPTYMNGLKIIRTAGLKVKGIPMDEEGLDTAVLEIELDRYRARDELPPFVYTIPDFHNPTGVVMSPERRARLTELAARYDFWILEDNPYRFMRIDGVSVPPLQSYDLAGRVISLGSFAKILGPGLRVAWMMARADVLDRLLVYKADSGTSPLAQLLIERYFSTVDLSDHLKRSTEIYRAKRDALDAALSEFMPDSASWYVPAGGYYVWLHTPGVDTDLLCQRGGQQGVKAYQGSVFFPENTGAEQSSAPKDSLRLAFAYETPERIRAGTRLLGSLVREALSEN